MISFPLCILWIDIRCAKYLEYYIWCHLSPVGTLHFRSAEQVKSFASQQLEGESRDPAHRTRSISNHVILGKTVPILPNIFLQSFYVEILWYNLFSPCSTAIKSHSWCWETRYFKPHHNIGMKISRSKLEAYTLSNWIFLLW